MKFKNWLKSNRLRVVLSFAALGIFLPGISLAGPLEQLIGDVLFTIVLGPFVAALNIEMWILPVIAKYNSFTTDEGIILGWKVLRDLANMFFILMLLIISFATIIGAKSYGYKQLLSRLIIVAILINFSRTIVGVVIDFSQIVMLTFLQAIEGVFHGGIFVALGLANLMNMSKDGFGDIATVIAALILGGIMLAITVIVIGIFIAMLVMRIIKIWIAVVLSPMAFLAYVFPKTQKYSNQWASTLGKELTAGPVMMFFLWLALMIVGNGDVNQKFITDEQAGQAPVEEISAAVTPKNLINYAIGIALLMGGLQAAAASGAMGAGLAGAASQQISSFASRKVRGLAGRTAAGLGRAVTDSEGNLRGGRLGTWIRRTPMYGGLIQRTALKAQGWDAQRRAQDRADSLKYVQDRHKRAYTASLSSSYYSPKDFKKVTYQKQDEEGNDMIDEKTGEAIMATDWFKVNKVGEYVDEDGKVLKDQKNVNLRVKHKARQKLWEPTYAVGRALKRISSLGESEEHDQAEALAIFDRNEVNSDNAEWVTRQLDSAGEEEKKQAVQGRYWTFAHDEKGKREAMRILRNKGLSGLLTDVQDASLFDDPDNPATMRAGAKQAIKALYDPEHGHADHNAINAAIHKNTKMVRWRISDGIMRNFEEIFEDDLKNVNAMFVDSNGQADINKRGGFDPNIATNPAVIAAQSIAKLYDQKVQDFIDPETGRITRIGPGSLIYAKMKHDLREGGITPGQIGAKAPRLFGETDEEYSERQAWLTELDNIKMSDPESLPDYIKSNPEMLKKFTNEDGKINKEYTENYRQRMYRQLLGELKPGEVPIDKKFQQVLDTTDPRFIFDNPNFHTNGKADSRKQAVAYVMMHNLPDMPRSDIFSQANTFAKETEEGTKARAAAYDKYGISKERQREIEGKIKSVQGVLDSDLKEVAPQIAEIFGDAAKTAYNDIKLNMIAGLAGDGRNAHDMTSSSFWTEVMDGALGSRIMEADTNDPMQRIQFDKALYSSETQQQGQAFAVGTPNQNRAMAEELVTFGKQPQKQLVENLPKAVAAQVMQKLADVLAMRRGDLPQDMTMLGPDIKKLITVLRGKAEEQGYGSDVGKFIKEKDGDGKIVEAINNFNLIFKKFGDRMGAEINIENNTYEEGGKVRGFDEWLEKWGMGYKMNKVDMFPKKGGGGDKDKKKKEQADEAAGSGI